MAVSSIALVAHDHQKAALIAWTKKHKKLLAQNRLLATGTTGALIAKAIDLPVHQFLSGPHGGDLQIGAAIAEGTIDMLIFFWDPLKSMPHEPDIKALLRVAALYNIPVACNETTADYLVTSPLMQEPYTIQRPQLTNAIKPASPIPGARV